MVCPTSNWVYYPLYVCVWSLIFIWAVQLGIVSALDYVEAFSVDVIVKESIN